MSRPGAAPLSPGVAGPRWRPLRSWSAGEREQAARRAEAAVRSWLGAWGLPETPHAHVGIGGEPAGGGSPVTQAAAARAWQALDEGAPGLWWAPSLPGTSDGAGGALLSSLSRALFGDGGTDTGGSHASQGAGGPPLTLAAEIARAAWADLGKRLAGTLGGASDVPGAEARERWDDAFRPWSGALILTWAGWDPPVAFLVSGGRMASFLAAHATPPRHRPDEARPALTPVWRALSRRTARVHVQTSPFELELGVLASLRVGDVIRTAHAIDLPLAVSVAGAEAHAGEVVCGAYLGKSGSVRAVELRSPARAAASSVPLATEGPPTELPPSPEPSLNPHVRDPR